MRDQLSDLSDNAKYPMDAKEFEKIVALGLGRAVLYLRDHDARPYREIILDACLHNKAYDPQVEGMRAEYVLELIRCTDEAASYENAVIQSLEDDPGDWDDEQRFRVARLLAQNGNLRAREAMHSAFRAKRISSSDIATEFIELDGIDGLLFVIGQIGEQLANNPDQWEDDYLLSSAGDICGKGKEDVDAALKNAAETDKNVEAYLTAVEQNQGLRALIQRPDPTALTYDELRSLIEDNKAGSVGWQWAQKATDSELKLAAYDLVQETDLTKLKSYLHLFAKRKFPLELDYLFRLVQLPDGPVPRHALRVLANLEHERIRSLAFNLVETRSTLRDYAIDLLVKNFTDGDHAIVEAWCDAEDDIGAVNAFDRSLRDFFAAHPDSEYEVRLLRKFYEREPCAHCRSFVVERLLQLDGLSGTLKHECEHDSYSFTRELVNPRN